jgi:hypothetical protein
MIYSVERLEYDEEETFFDFVEVNWNINIQKSCLVDLEYVRKETLNWNQKKENQDKKIPWLESQIVVMKHSSK